MPSSSLANLCTTAVSPSARSTCRLPTSIPTYTVSELSTVFSFYRGRLRLRSLLQTRAQRRPKQLFERIPEAPNLATRLPDGLLAQEVIGQPDPALGPLLIPQTQRTRGRRVCAPGEGSGPSQDRTGRPEAPLPPGPYGPRRPLPASGARHRVCSALLFTPPRWRGEVGASARRERGVGRRRIGQGRRKPLSRRALRPRRPLPASGTRHRACSALHLAPVAGRGRRVCAPGEGSSGYT